MSTHSLYQRSLQVIKAGQSNSGAYIASPNFPNYRFCWLRDGSFIAYAMDTAKEYESADAFYRWVGNTIQKHAAKVDHIRHTLASGSIIGKDDILHTRYTVDGEEAGEDSGWGNFQIDGYGTWLWGLTEHVRRSGNFALLQELAEPVKTTLQYLELVWQLPNYDCWEEYPDLVHPYTLASVFSGLASISSLDRDGRINVDAQQVSDLAEQVKTYILEHSVLDGHFVKHIRLVKDAAPLKSIPQGGVDASLIGMAVPYQVLAPDHPLVRSTIQCIEQDLHRPGGGVYRYQGDVYYGGGEWLLLTAWLGWYYTQVGDLARACQLRSWIEAQADEQGFLAEQVNDHTLAPQHLEPWIQKWGQVAKPLLWSHAMYVILENAIQQHSQNG